MPKVTRCCIRPFTTIRPRSCVHCSRPRRRSSMRRTMRARRRCWWRADAGICTLPGCSSTPEPMPTVRCPTGQRRCIGRHRRATAILWRRCSGPERRSTPATGWARRPCSWQHVPGTTRSCVCLWSVMPKSMRRTTSSTRRSTMPENAASRRSSNCCSRPAPKDKMDRKS